MQQVMNTSPMPTRVLFLHADTKGFGALIDALSSNGFNVREMTDAPAGIQAALDGAFELLLVERSMPGTSGLDALRQIRRHSSVPVMLLAQDSDELERVLCLELGADDILEQPGSRELIARMRAILRRTGANDPTASIGEYIEAGPLKLWPHRRRAHWFQGDLPLTSTEFSLLELLVRESGRAVSKKRLSDEVLSRPYQRHDRTIDVHVSNIRHKLGQRGDNSEWIQTIRGVGYLWARD